MDESKPTTNAERVAAHRAREKAKPLLERLGYPDLAEVFSQRALAIQKDLEGVQSRADTLNAEMMDAVRKAPDTGNRAKALADLSGSRRLSIKPF